MILHGDPPMNSWLAVESNANWHADRTNGFKFLGIAERRMGTAKRVKTGDVVFIYLPRPVRAFADIRLVEKDGVGKHPHLMHYDIACYAGIYTRSLVKVEKENWLPLAAVRDNLSFGRQPSAGMRVSFRQITSQDAAVLVGKYRKSFPSVNTKPVQDLFTDHVALVPSDHLVS